MNTAHEVLKRLVDLGYTQKQIASGTGINQPTISRLLNKEQADIRSAKWEKLKAFANICQSTQEKAA